MNRDFSSVPAATAPTIATRTSLIRPMLVLFVALSVITGLLYPGLVTGLAGALFPRQASGSLLADNGKVVGSALIGQPFSAPGYFWSRPSATSPMPYNAAASGGSNLGPTNPALGDAARERIEILRRADPGNMAPVPVDLVTASGSGLDPHISPAAAEYQLARVARVRGVPVEQLRRLVAAHTEAPPLAVLGDPVVNVLTLNLALDRLTIR